MLILPATLAPPDFKPTVLLKPIQSRSPTVSRPTPLYVPFVFPCDNFPQPLPGPPKLPTLHACAVWRVLCHASNAEQPTWSPPQTTRFSRLLSSLLSFPSFMIV